MGNTIKTIWATSITDVKDTDVEGVGRLRYEDDGSVYRWVKNNNASAAMTEGEWVCHKASDGANMTKYVTTPATADLMLAAGVVMAPTLAAGKYGWIQVLGYNGTAKWKRDQNTAMAIGHVGKLEDAKTAIAYGVVAGTAPLYTRFGVLLEALATTTPAANTSAKTWISCL